MARRITPVLTCSADDCDKEVSARGLCSKHYYRWRKHGDVSVTLRIRGDDRARFESYIDRQTDGCWPWMGALHKDGYGIFNVSARTWLAHRWAYEQFVGPVPDGLELDHLCRNRRCVNPAHLEPVLHRENVRRGDGWAINARRTHCPQGHPYDEANTRWVRRDGTFIRVCRSCSREHNRRLRQRKREQESL